MTKGTRKFDGRYFILSGRGTKEACRREAHAMRKTWRYIRIVPANPFFHTSTREALDDWMIYVFERIETKPAAWPPRRYV